jgi:hypothetical protein
MRRQMLRGYALHALCLEFGDECLAAQMPTNEHRLALIIRRRQTKLEMPWGTASLRSI